MRDTTAGGNASLMVQLLSDACASKDGKRTGPDEAGLTYVCCSLDAVRAGWYEDILLWRDRSGQTRGVLYHAPQEMPPLQRRGEVTILVHPSFRRRGIATALLGEAVRRWGVDFQQQRYTADGVRFVAVFRARRERRWPW